MKRGRKISWLLLTLIFSMIMTALMPMTILYAEGDDNDANTGENDKGGNASSVKDEGKWYIGNGGEYGGTRYTLYLPDGEPVYVDVKAGTSLSDAIVGYQTTGFENIDTHGSKYSNNWV